jgi:hypothetical protein
MSTIQQAHAAMDDANRIAAQCFEQTGDTAITIHGLIPSAHKTEVVIRVHLLDMNYVYEVGPIVGRRGLVSRNAFITTSRPKAIALLACGLEYRKSRRKQKRLF